MEDELLKKLRELEIAVKANAESSNSRMQNVNQMITNILSIMNQAISEQKVLEEALRQEQRNNAELIKNSAELVRECRDLRLRCEDLSHQVRHSWEIIGKSQGITIENKQM